VTRSTSGVGRRGVTTMVGSSAVAIDAHRQRRRASATLDTPSDLLRVADLSRVQLDALLDLADGMADEPASWTRLHPRTAVACLFDASSAATRVSFEAAAHRLGILPIVLRPGELGLGPGDPLLDTARLLSSHAAAIVVGTPLQATLADLADAATVPVINGHTREQHPCRALADLLTLRRRFGSLGGLRVVYAGDGRNVAHSLMEAGGLAGMHVVVAGPAGREPHGEVTARAAALAARHGGSVRVASDTRAAVRDADAVYGGAWDGSGRAGWDDPANRLAIAQALLHVVVTGGWAR